MCTSILILPACLTQRHRASVKAPGAHSAENLRKAALQSVAKLAPHKINVYYLHTPDRSVPYEETSEAINQLYKDGIMYARLPSIQMCQS